MSEARRLRHPITTRFVFGGIALATAFLLVHTAHPMGSAGAVTSVRLKTISARVGMKGTSVVIEASEPVAYVATRPDPLTLLIDFRNVVAEGVTNSARPASNSPIASISVEADASLSAPVSRVRIALVEPVGHHVRSERSRVVVDLDSPSGKAAPFVLAPAARAQLGNQGQGPNVSAQDRPDAMKALLGPVEQAQPPVDPIATLGLGQSSSGQPSPGSTNAGTQVLNSSVPGSNVASSAVSASSVAAFNVLASDVALSGNLQSRSNIPNSGNGDVAANSRSGNAGAASNTVPIGRTGTARPSQAPAPSPQQSAPSSQASPTSPATPQADQVGTSRNPRQFTGHPISLDFQGADLRAVLRTFSEISGLNVVIDPSITGTVDVALRDVPWDQALDIILRANKLGYMVDGTIVRIAPLSVLADEESQRRKLGEEQALAGQLEVLTKTISYAKAQDLEALLTKSALSPRGTVQVDQRTNTLIITDLPDRLTVASDLIGTLDRAQPQVEIEARIVQTNKNYARAIGVQWGFNGQVSPALGNTTPLPFPNNGSIGGRTGGTQGPAGSTQPTAVNLPVTGASSAVGLALGSINGAFNLDVALSALESTGNGRLLSTPRVTTQNNVAAEMTQGVQIPIQTVANNTVTVQFKDAALTLKVVPQITAANTVIMQISVENASPDFSRAVNNIPPINTQRANTTVLVSDGQTTVIGGIYVSQEQAQNDRTPGLGQVPLLRWLFKRDSVNDQNTELLIFITPRIIKG